MDALTKNAKESLQTYHLIVNPVFGISIVQVCSPLWEAAQSPSSAADNILEALELADTAFSLPLRQQALQVLQVIYRDLQGRQQSLLEAVESDVKPVADTTKNHKLCYFWEGHPLSSQFRQVPFCCIQLLL